MHLYAVNYLLLKRIKNLYQTDLDNLGKGSSLKAKFVPNFQIKPVYFNPFPKQNKSAAAILSKIKAKLGKTSINQSSVIDRVKIHFCNRRNCLFWVFSPFDPMFLKVACSRCLNASTIWKGFKFLVYIYTYKENKPCMPPDGHVLNKRASCIKAIIVSNYFQIEPVLLTLSLIRQYCSRRLWTYFIKTWKISLIEWIT